VARFAGHVGVAVGQQKTGGAVIELGVQPVIKRGMAGFAGGREFRRDVIGIDGLLEIRHVARRASRRESGKLSDRSVLVAPGAFHSCVGAQQRKTIEVILDRLHRNIPAHGSVALGAVGAKLAAVNIRVAVGAILAHVGEDGFHMAFRAINFFVHPAQGIARGVVIKFGNGADRSPARRGVAVLARKGKRSVRTPARLALRIGRVRKGKRQPYKDR